MIPPVVEVAEPPLVEPPVDVFGTPPQPWAVAQHCGIDSGSLAQESALLAAMKNTK
jgi:hypothetical protein